MSDVLVLCYHALSEGWPAELSTTPERFERQLRLLAARGYRGVTFSEAVASPPSGKAVAITFDDGFKSVIERACPLMSELGFVGTVFVVTGYVGSAGAMRWPGVDHWIGGEHEHELMPMTAADLEELAGAGWEVGSHTRTHPRLTGLDDKALAGELSSSRKDCEQLLGRPCASLAYPYGDCDERVVQAAAAAGYRSAGALSSRLRAARPLEWPRVGIYHGDDDRRFRAKVSPAVRRLRGSKAWELVERARGLVRGR
jgi:peptidoglycan/xylan/chitin deacetylase (PgdA/CDA1 family)